MWLAGFVIAANIVGVILLLTPLFRTFAGSCLLIIYELIFLIASLVWLSVDYSIVIAIIAFALIYVAIERRKENKNVGVSARV